MQLTNEQIDFIRSDIQMRGMTMDTLAESLLDHICCIIESNQSDDFDKSYQIALESFGSGGIEMIQKETILLINLKKEIVMKKTMYVMGYVAATMISTGLLFKIQHWQGAAILLTLGVLVLNFAFLPMFFYSRYRQAIG